MSEHALLGGPTRQGERLGAGAITESFVATSFGAEGFEKTVVVKRVHAELAAIPRFVDAFLVEAQRASGLSHANVVLLMDVARDGTGYHLVTEYVDGVDLATLLALTRAAGAVLPDAMIAFIGAEIAKGLDYAHRRRGGAVVHGGLSPSNVLVSRDGAVKISDFGVHRAREDARFAPHETRAAPYRAPERVLGGDATKSGDLFALGAILRELAGGRLPFVASASPREGSVSIDALLGPEEGRPTAGDLHERVLAWAFREGGVAQQASELAKLVARLRHDGAAASAMEAPADVAALADAFEDAQGEPAPPAGSTPAGLPAKLREVVLVAVTDLGGAEGAALVRRLIEDGGGVVTQADDVELRAVFGLASDEGRDVRDALRTALAISASSARVGVAVDLGRALVDERGKLVEDASSSERFARVAALASTAGGQVSVSPELVRATLGDFEFAERSDSGRTERRSFLVRERHRPLASSRSAGAGRFVGRRAELARLGARWASARSGSPCVVAITGASGAGKTRLALEFERRVLLRDPALRAGFVGGPGDALDAVDLVIVESFDGVGPRLSRAAGAARGAGARTMFVLVARSLDAELAAVVDEELALGALADDEVAELAASLVGARVLTPEFMERLRDAADRTPLFVSETIRDWMDQALVVVRDGVAHVHAGVVSPPRTLRALVEARLDRLSTEELATLRALAIASEDATDEEVAAIVGVGSASVVAARALFSPLVRQVVLDSVPVDARRALHAAAERALAVEGAIPSAPRRAERVGLHRLEAGDASGARDAFIQAATMYARPADRARVAALALRLLAPTGRATQRDAELVASVPRLVAMLAAGAELGVGAEAWLDLARDAFERVDRAGTLADRVVVRLETARLGVHLAAVPEARVALDQASNLAIDVRLRARVLATEMELAIRTGEIARGRDAASALFDLGSIDLEPASQGATPRLRELESAAVLADAAEIFGAARDAPAAEAALALALDIGADASPAVRAALEARRARIELSLGHPTRALRTSVIAVDLADAVGATRLRAEAKLTLAECAIHAGRLDRAYAALVAALEASESSGHSRAATSAAALLAWLDAPADLDGARAKLAALSARADARGFAADALSIRLLAARLDGSPVPDALAPSGEATRATLRAIEADALRLGHGALAADARSVLDSPALRGPDAR